MATRLQAELVRALTSDRALADVHHALWTLFGITPRVLFRDGGEVVEVYPSPPARRVGAFCAAVRATPEGRTRCALCQTSIAFRAAQDRLSNHQCHGGACVLATPAKGSRATTSDRLVVATGAFLRDRQKFQTLSLHLLELKLTWNDARAACGALPVLTDAQLAEAKHFVAIAASIAGNELERLPDSECASHAGVAIDSEQALRAVFSSYDPTGDEPPGPGTGNNVVDLIIAVVTRTPDMEFTLTNLAKAARITPNHLSTLFHRHYGKRFSEFLVEQRVKAAVRILQDPSVTVEEAATRSGFNNVSYFCRCFRRLMGATPGKWRKRHGGA